MEKSDFTLHTPYDRQNTGFFKTIWIMAKNTWQSKQLIWQLFRRDFLMSYKKSFLGIAWILIAPAVGIISWILLNSTGILQPGETGIPYPAFVLISSSLWGLFTGIYTSSSGTLNAGSGFIMQVRYPHESLLIKQLAQLTAGFVITFIFNLAVLIVFGIYPDWKIILLPILILPMFFLGSALGLVLSVVAVVAQDISSIVNTLIGFSMYVTPIIYDRQKAAETPLLAKVVDLNPLTYLVADVRDLILFGQMQYPERYLLVSLIAFVLFLIALRLFYVSEYKAIEKMI